MGMYVPALKMYGLHKAAWHMVGIHTEVGAFSHYPRVTHIHTLLVFSGRLATQMTCGTWKYHQHWNPDP